MAWTMTPRALTQVVPVFIEEAKINVIAGFKVGTSTKRRFLVTSTSADNSSYVPSDLIFLNCGSSSFSPTPTSYGRQWTGDIGSKFLPSTGQHHNSTTSTATLQFQDDQVPKIPYMTARIFHFSPFTYSFPVSAGPKFLRLHFYPASYSGLDPSKAFFSVTTGRYTLLHNFSASLTADALNFAYFSREFSINVEENQRLINLTFTPSPDASDAYAFVNGIEIVSVAPNLYVRGRDVPLSLVGSLSLFYIDNTSALEMLYRLNVGGNYISPEDDTGMFRTWSQDEDYIFGSAVGAKPYNFSATIRYPKTVPAYTAPVSVYGTSRSMGPYANINKNYNLTWIFPADSGFNYLVRLHFCELPDFNLVNQRVFTIFINNLTAEKEMDVIYWSGGAGVPMYIDYVVMVPETNGGKQDLWLALHPNTESRSEYCDAILNGVEIFKLSNGDGNLAGLNPPQRVSVVGHPPEQPLQPLENSKKKKTIIITGAVLGGVVALFFLSLIIVLLKMRKKRTSCWVALFHHLGLKKNKTSSLQPNQCRTFSIIEIKAATNNFDETLVIGVGGFGKVYKGYIDGGATTVAIKRGNPTSHQGVHEFQTEIEILTQLRHLHLVSLIGYCQEEQEMILVYDYLANGTLRDHLYNTQKPPLPWKQRLKICIGAARGLHYLHTGAKRLIIHRDVKSTNILLDDKWVAKVSDFGLSKVGPVTVSQTHVSTVVKGSFGYLDPEYYRRQKLTEKSDVYSFGVVLWEVLCARPAVSRRVNEEEEETLAEWALCCHRNGTLDQMIDPYLRGKIAPECLTTFAEIAKKCLADRGMERPEMGDVLWDLEMALQRQDSADAEEGFVGGHLSRMKDEATVTINYEQRAGNFNSDVTPGIEFSELMMPMGR
ncbi:hypothetical protein HHK36_015528 [Tetracentron sinense]|uniref:Protein kinase domain-containing protein n=1 Tax=Tetracentron sinense TaxID=13715 RepID=A0A835DDQ7_TETSI|nr:hypothetical protein HHK36_015528 [Tetracentron sinense]